MTHTRNARIAGFTFLFYIVAGITGMVLFGQATRGAEGTAATLASIAQHATTVRLTVLLTLAGFASAVVLAVTIYALTRDEDRDLALLALCFRVSEGVIGAIAAVRTLGLLAVATASTATASTATAAPDAAAAIALGALLLKAGGLFTNIGATAFAIGSTLYSYLFLRARSIPVPLAWLGVVALGAARGSSSTADGRFPPRTGDLLHLDTYARVRSGVRAVADHQGSRHASEPTSLTGMRRK